MGGRPWHGSQHPTRRRERARRCNDAPALLVGQHSALEAIQRRFRTSEKLFAFFDDIHAISNPRRVRATDPVLEVEMRTRAGTRIHTGKTQVWKALLAVTSVARAVSPEAQVWKGPELHPSARGSLCWARLSDIRITSARPNCVFGLLWGTSFFRQMGQQTNSHVPPSHLAHHAATQRRTTNQRASPLQPRHGQEAAPHQHPTRVCGRRATLRAREHGEKPHHEHPLFTRRSPTGE